MHKNSTWTILPNSTMFRVVQNYTGRTVGILIGRVDKPMILIKRIAKNEILVAFFLIGKLFFRGSLLRTPSSVLPGVEQIWKALFLN